MGIRQKSNAEELDVMEDDGDYASPEELDVKGNDYRGVHNQRRVVK